MGKKKSKSKAAKPSLSKKDLRKLEEREATLRAELERRAEKKTKKAKGKKKTPVVDHIEPAPVKKSKKSKKLKAEPVEIAFAGDAGALGVMTIEAEAPIVTAPEAATPDDKPTPEAVLAAAETVLSDPNSSSGATEKALKAKKRALAELESDAQIKERVNAKRAARDLKAARMPDALEGETEAQYQMRKLDERKAADAEAKAIAKTREAVDAIKQAVDVVETEHGREFVAGDAAAIDAPEEFAKPSEAAPELESGRNGYKIIQLDADGKPDPRKVRQMTRVTTFVGNIDDETSLKLWEKRLLSEGLAAHAEEYAPTINDLVHRRDVTIAKARRADRKGKLGVGEVGVIEERAMKEYKAALNALNDEVLELAGRHEKADAGTDLHTLAEVSDEKGIDAVREMHERDEISATELTSIEAYAARMARLGAKVIESEAVIVNDAMGYAGRLDRIIMAKLPELVVGRGTPGEYVRPADQRARRYVTDIKSGSLEYGAGKIARQLTAYAHGDLYDLETGERSRHSAARDIALVFHLPQGKGECTVHAVDLKAGLALLKLSADVRRARNTGKKTIDVSVDIADPAADTETSEA